jgi:alpha-N-acetylglucosaminidase
MNMRTGELRPWLTACALGLGALAGTAPAGVAGSKVDPQIEAVAGLLARCVPKVAQRFDLALIGREAGTGRDAFEVKDGAAGRIDVRGSSGVALAMGVNWYLKNVCHAHMSWCGDRLDVTPKQLGPIPGGKVRVVCPHRHVVYFNYCTLSYTAAWWNWQRWEREIDFMALNGVNMPLATVGLEGVWYSALLRVGLTDAEARSFLVLPAHFAWQWMANIDGFDQPLPRSWIDSHVELGHRILDRERAFGMTPIQQGFSGHVPALFKTKFPKAAIVAKPRWSTPYQGTWQLDPLDPLFMEFGRVFMEEEKKLLGLGGYYAADPFHESSPPRPGPEYLQQVGEAIHRLFDSVDPHSVWAMQSWSIRREIACAVPRGRLLILDLGGGGWQGTQGFWGHDFVVGQIHNFGGRINLHGDLGGVAYNWSVKAKARYPQAVGMGLFMEGIEQNPVFYDLVFDMIWRDAPVALDDWLKEYVRRRYGVEGGPALEAWMLLKATAYGRGSTSLERSSIIAARPALNVKKSGPNEGFEIRYDPLELAKAWRLLLAAREDCGASDGYRFDVVDVGRQVLSNLGQELHRDVRRAFESKDRPGFKKASAQFEELLRDTDRLLETRREYRFGEWLAAARRWGTTDAERNLYDRNASMLVTYWGPNGKDPHGFDYSWREWSGLIREYYLPRWEEFHRFLDGKLATGASYSEEGLPQVHGREAWRANEFYDNLADLEAAWVDRPKADWKPLKVEDPVAVALVLSTKWFPVIESVYSPERKALLADEERKTLEARTGMQTVLEWSPKTLTSGAKDVDVDTGSLIDREATYEVLFQHQSGGRVALEWVALMQDGREIGRDTHAGLAGHPPKDNVYRLKLEALTAGAQYGLRVRMRGLDGPASSGLIGVRKAGKTAGR